MVVSTVPRLSRAWSPPCGFLSPLRRDPMFYYLHILPGMHLCKHCTRVLVTVHTKPSIPGDLYHQCLMSVPKSPHTPWPTHPNHRVRFLLPRVSPFYQREINISGPAGSQFGTSDFNELSFRLTLASLLYRATLSDLRRSPPHPAPPPRPL